MANLLEVMNYSLTFYIYCLFSEDFRNTLIRTLTWPWCSKTGTNNRRLNAPVKLLHGGQPTATITPPTTTSALAASHHHLATANTPAGCRASV